ncbi:MAG: hypothetical protein R8K53_03650 [Mariprofundaceae bacterium]
MPEDSKNTAGKAQETVPETTTTAATKPKTSEQTASKPPVVAAKKKIRVGPWLFLMFIFIGLPAAWMLTPSDSRQQALDALQRFISPPQHSTSLEPTVSVDEHSLQTNESTTVGSVAAEEKEASAPSPEADSSLLPAVLTDAPSGDTQSASPERLGTQNDALINEMQQLRSDLAAMQQVQSALQSQLQARQRLELRAWLRWVMQKETHLQQRVTLWNDIATLPILNDDERKTAADLAVLASADLTQKRNWQSTLTHLAEQLPLTRQTDILPKPENDRFAWLADAFHLRPAQGQAQKQRAVLHQKIVAMEHALAMEHWPQDRDWRRLLGTLRDQFGDDTDLGLPENLLDIQQHIETQRGTAADWLERL